MVKHAAKSNTSHKVTKRNTRSAKQLQQTLLTTHSPLTQQPPTTTTITQKTNKNSHTEHISSDDSSEDSPVELQYSVSTPRKMDFSEDDNSSESTNQMDNTLEELPVTRVDIKIKIPPSESPEETTTRVLQKLLIKLKYYDNKTCFAPWQESSKASPICSATEMPSRPSELETYFPRIRIMRTGTTWYSGVRIIHSVPMPELKKDMLPWLKDEGHGLFTRTLQAENLVDVGWFVYSTWEMEAEALAAAISAFINIEIGLRWKLISLGTRDRIPTEQQVRALHVEVSVENRMVAQKALLAVYGRKSTGSYPNGIRLRFALPISSAYNLNTKAKLEKLRYRQQMWNQTYKKGQTWEITQLDYKLTNSLTLRQALTKIISTTDKRFPLFHSVDRSTSKMAGVSFQFLPELESEARLMISNLLPYLHHHYGEEAKHCFTPTAVERLKECQWNSESGTIVGAYDDEINFLDETDIMTQYINSKTINNPNTTTPSTLIHSPPTKYPNPEPLQSTAYGNDDDSVSTLGNYTTRKWTKVNTPSPIRTPGSIPNAISHSDKPSDDNSVGSISTLNTRINSIEGQFHELSGTMEQIKNMLNILASPKTAQDGDPRRSDHADRGNSVGESS